MEEQDDPITRIFPHEITGYIFETYVDLHKKPIDIWDKGFASPGVAFTISAVCRKWRAIALSSHSLWSALSINLLSAGHAHGPVLVQQWLGRTGGVVISVQIRQDSRKSGIWKLEGQVEDDARSVMAIIDSYSAKITNLDIRELTLRITPWLTTPSTGSVLQILRVSYSEFEEIRTALNDGIRLFDGAGVKHSPAFLSMDQWSIPPRLLNIHWSNLTDLSLRYSSRVIAFEAIKLSALRLQNLTLQEMNGLTVQDGNWLPPRSIDLPELVLLSYTEMGSSPGTSAVLFNTIRVPSLTVLDYVGYEEDNLMPIQEIIECIQRSSCSIEEFLVDGANFHDFPHFLLLLHEMPALEILDISLSRNHSVEPILQKLQHARDQPLFLPRLYQLKLSVQEKFEWMSFVKIWLAAGSFGSEGQYIDEEFEVRQERMDLEAQMTVRDTTGQVNYLTPEALLAFMRINRSVNGGVSIRQSKGNRSSLHSDINLIEASCSHYLSIYKGQS